MQSQKTINLLLLMIILWGALFLRTVDICSTPGLSGDESFNGADAARALRGNWQIFYTNNYGREPLFINSIALSMGVFGENILAIRLTSVFYAMLGLVISYALVKRLWCQNAALLSTGLMAFSFWPLFMSRIGLRAITLPTLQVFVIYALYRGIQTKHREWLYASGACLGLTLYTYIPARVFPVVPVLWLIAIMLLGPKPLREHIKTMRWHLLISALIALIVFAPLGMFFIKSPDLANQRIGELSYTLDSLKEGNLQPLLSNAGKLVRMFIFEGDPDVYYNIPGRSVFQIPLGLCFFSSLMLSLWRYRKPSSQLLLIWLGVMLSPSLLSTGNAILRSVGALFPIYVLPATLLIELLSKILKQSTFAKSTVTRVAFLVLVLVSVGWSAQHAFFDVWTEIPRIRSVYSKAINNIGQAMTSALADEVAPNVVVGCVYAADLCRDMVRFQTQYNGPIKWVDAGRAIVAPVSDGTADDVWYFIADGFPLPEMIVQYLNHGDLLQQFGEERIEGQVYRLNEQQVKEAFAPQFEVQGRFEDMMLMLGYDMPDDVQRGQTLVMTVYWQVPESFNAETSDPPFWSVTLSDGRVHYWSEFGGILPYSVWDWQPGDIVLQYIPLDIPYDVPQGEWTPVFTLYRQQAGTIVYVEPDGTPRRSLVLEPIQVVGNPERPISAEVQPFGALDELGLVSVTPKWGASAGSAYPLVFEWQALADVQHDYQLKSAVYNTDVHCTGEALLSNVQPLVDGYPASLWQGGEPIETTSYIPIDSSLPNGAYNLGLDLLWTDADGDQHSQLLQCRELPVSGRPHSYDFPDPQHTVNISFEEGVNLLGWDINVDADVVHSGDSFNITLYWQPVASVPANYMLFVHVYADTSRSEILTQRDIIPCNGACPTLGWLPEEVISDTVTISLPEDTTPGAYSIGVGLYDVFTFERLGIPDVPDDVIILTELYVD